MFVSNSASSGSFTRKLIVSRDGAGMVTARLRHLPALTCETFSRTARGKRLAAGASGRIRTFGRAGSGAVGGAGGGGRGARYSVGWIPDGRPVASSGTVTEGVIDAVGLIGVSMFVAGAIIGGAAFTEPLA